MSSQGPAIRRDGDALLLNVKGRPSARVDKIKGVTGDLIAIDIAAKPEDGKATEHMLQFLAKSFGVNRREVELVSGAHARWKRVRIEGAWVVPSVLQEALADAG